MRLFSTDQFDSNVWWHSLKNFPKAVFRQNKIFWIQSKKFDIKNCPQADNKFPCKNLVKYGI